MRFLSVLLILIVVGLVLAYGIYLLTVINPSPITSLNEVGVFGDSFGVLTSLFSGLAFAGIILTILLQREELKLQREELRQTREELFSQHETAKLQTFENTFFQMLRVHNDIVNSIDLQAKTKNFATTTSGRDCFNVFYTRLETIHNKNLKNWPNGLMPEEVDLLEKSYDEFWKENGRELAHYFRYLYNLLRFVEERAPDKKFYARIERWTPILGQVA